MAAFLSNICCSCFGRQHKPKKGNAAESRGFTTRAFSSGNLIGAKIEALGAASMARGGKPASKSPLTSSGTGTNAQGFDEADLHETLYTKLPGGARASETDSEDSFLSRRAPVKETYRAHRYEVRNYPPG